MSSQTCEGKEEIAQKCTLNVAWAETGVIRKSLKQDEDLAGSDMQCYQLFYMNLATIPFLICCYVFISYKVIKKQRNHLVLLTLYMYVVVKHLFPMRLASHYRAWDR